jgi:hypothetical protein
MTTVRLLKRQTDTRGRSNARLSSLSDSRVTKVTIQTLDPIRLANGSNGIAKWIFPYAPNDITISNLSDAYQQLDRPGRLPVLQRSARNPLQVDISSLIVKRDSTSTAVAPIDDEILLLRRVANSNVNLIVGAKALGRLHHGIRFRMTNFSLESVRRDPQQRMTIANVSLTLLQVHAETKKVPGMIAIADIPPARRTSSPQPDTNNNSLTPYDQWVMQNANQIVRSLAGSFGSNLQ